MSEVETPEVSIPEGGAQTDAAEPRRHRATKVEMAGRERAAMKLLEKGPITINKLCTVTGLSYPKALKLIQRLKIEGRVQEIGTDGVRTLYRLEEQAAPAKPVTRRPTVSFQKFLDLFHPGQDMKVVGLELTESGATVVARIDDQVVKLSPTNS